MKKDLAVVLLILTTAVVFWRNAFFNFFTQDDFIFIEHFSQNNFWQDLKNVFGPPVVTHWRPFHNLYFLIAGNFFGKAYYLYHALILFLHVATGFLIYKIVVKIWKNFNLALVASLIYVIHPAHFVAMYWISGSAVNIGFFFLLLSFYVYLKGIRLLSLLLYIMALLSSEAMIAGTSLFVLSSLLGKRVKLDKKFLAATTGVILVFLVIKLLNTSSAAFEIYRLEISSATLFALYYYALRILGFAESSGDFVPSLILVIFLLIAAWRGLNYLILNWKKAILAAGGFVGLFPFVLLPSHLSPHYMVLPIFGFSQFLSLGVSRFSKAFMIIGFLLFAAVSFLNIGITEKNNWVSQRGNLAKKYLAELSEKNLARGSTIVIDSKELYIALGQGSAIDFWFSKNYFKKCFSFLEDCEKTVNKSGDNNTAIGT